MNTNIEQYINSGILEVYVIGAASPAEENEIIYLKQKYPQVQHALNQLESDMESLAKIMAITPPPGMWAKIETEIEDLIVREKTAPNPFTKREYKTYPRPDNASQYIEVEAENNYMKVNRAWKWIFAAVFILGKIFLGCAIYFYLENRQAQQQVQELKSEMQLLKK